MKLLDEILERGRKRHAELAKIQKPYKKVLGVASAASFLYKFLANGGQFTLSVLALAALTIFIVYYATSVDGIKLFSLRALALLIDLCIVGFALYLSASWYQTYMEKPGDVLRLGLGDFLMVSLWVAFLYFVLLDWRLKGTVGKRLLGLSVVSTSGDALTLSRSFIRAFMSIPLPVIAAVLLSHQIAGNEWSPVRWFTADCFRKGMLSLIPLSIVLFDGNQGLADLVTRSVVRARGKRTTILPVITTRKWMLFSFSFLALAAVLASLWYLAAYRPFFTGYLPPLPPGFSTYEIRTDPQTAAALWTVLPTGIKEPSSVIRKVELVEEPGNPFSLQGESSYFNPILDPTTDFKKMKQLPVLRLTLASNAPLQARLMVIYRFLAFDASITSVEKRPAFTVLQVQTQQEFGLFSIDRQENLLACLVVSEGKPVSFFTDVSPRGQILFPVSLDKVGFLLVGAGLPY